MAQDVAKTIALHEISFMNFERTVRENAAQHVIFNFPAVALNIVDDQKRDKMICL